MKGTTACIPCIMKQAYNTAIRTTNDERVIREILDKTADYVKKVNLEETPADLSNYVYKVTREITGIKDPYAKDKRTFNDICLGLYDTIKKEIDKTDEPLHYAIKASIYGNLIDLGIGLKFDIEKDIMKIFSEKLTVDDYTLYQRYLSGGRKNILILGDNAGEIVFDRLLVEKLVENNDVTYVVKKGPIINDSTMEDAEYTGMTKVTKVIDTGSDGIGVKWDEASDMFVNHFNSADIILSKGQGNFETVSGRPQNIFFMLRAKCDSVAEELGVKFGDIVFKHNPLHNE